MRTPRRGRTPSDVSACTSGANRGGLVGPIGIAALCLLAAMPEMGTLGADAEAAKMTYGGRTIEQWITEWESRSRSKIEQASETLTKIGRPAVPALIECLRKGNPRASYARHVLRGIGEEASEAIPWLIDTALGQNADSGAHAYARSNAIYVLGAMGWAAGRVAPVLEHIARSPDEDAQMRERAVGALEGMGRRAIPILKELAAADPGEVREKARSALASLLEKEGTQTRKAYYSGLIDRDPFDPSVPGYLTKTKRGAISNGYYNASHALTDKIKTLYRERLRENPDAELAWRLVTIIDTGLANTALGWAAPVRSWRGRWGREDPTDNYVTMGEVLELGLGAAGVESGARTQLGIALAKLRLLQGDWDGMNAVLVRLGQKPMPREARPWLSAPPCDWEEDLAARWGAADESLRLGTCGLEFRIYKDGRGLKGAHFLIKRAPEPEGDLTTGLSSTTVSTGRPTDTLFFNPSPVSGSGGKSFGYGGRSDRGRTRYAVSDESGMVRFDRLPNIPIKIEVLVPTANFPEPGRNWDLWMETPGGEYRLASNFGDHDRVRSHEPPAVVQLQEGETVRYPKLVVCPVFGLNLRDWRLRYHGFEDPAEVRRLVAKLREAAHNGDKTALVNAIHYPFTVYESGTPVRKYEASVDVLEDYDAVFSEDVLSALSSARYNSLFVRDQGAMIGDGEVWLYRYDVGVRIKAINP